MHRRASPAPLVTPADHACYAQLPSDIPSDISMSTVSRETKSRLARYVALVETWTRTINLVSRGDQQSIWSRHVFDSMRLLPLIPNGTSRGADLGSGAGFPGLVIALMTNIPFDLIEADQRKAAFLLEAKRVTGAPVTIHCARIEALTLSRVPLMTARALAPLSTLLEYADRLLLPNGIALFPKGTRAQQEIEEARHTWRMRVNCFDDPRHPGSTILSVTELSRARPSI